MSIFSNKLVVVYVLQILIFLTSLSAQNTSSIPLAASTKSSITNNTTTANNNAPKAPTATKNQEIVAEGGGKIEMPVEPSVNVSQPHNREHVITKPPTTNNHTILSPSAPPVSSSPPKIQTHLNSSTNAPTVNRTEQRITHIENSTPNKTAPPDHQKIFPRKGVNNSDFVELKPKPKKPTITVASDEPFASSHFQSKSNSSASHAIPKVPNLDIITESNQGNTQKYVVPIVIVILSVPFIAILISILYKRGSEWWKYRHYRRMDFLINGMYDN